MAVFDSLAQTLSSQNPLNDLVDRQVGRVTGFFRDEETNINKIQFDVITNETFQTSVQYVEEVTDFGFSLTQGIARKPRKIILTGMFGKHVSRQSELDAIEETINTKVNTFLPYTGSFTKGALTKINEVKQTVQANLATIDRGINDLRSLVKPFSNTNKTSKIAKTILTLENMALDSTPIKIVSNEIGFEGSWRISDSKIDRKRDKTNDIAEATITLIEILQMDREGVFFNKKIDKRVQRSINQIKNKGELVTKDKTQDSLLLQSANFFRS